MSVLVIPIDSSFYDQSFSMDLEGSVYSFRFKYNRRSDRWTMDIGREDESVIVGGISLVSNHELIRRFAKSELPPGTLIALNLFETSMEPSEFSFDDSFALLYEEYNG